LSESLSVQRVALERSHKLRLLQAPSPVRGSWRWRVFVRACSLRLLHVISSVAPLPCTIFHCLLLTVLCHTIPSHMLGLQVFVCFRPGRILATIQWWLACAREGRIAEQAIRAVLPFKAIIGGHSIKRVAHTIVAGIMTFPSPAESRPNAFFTAAWHERRWRRWWRCRQGNPVFPECFHCFPFCNPFIHSCLLRGRTVACAQSIALHASSRAHCIQRWCDIAFLLTLLIVLDFGRVHRVDG